MQAVSNVSKLDS